MSVSLAKGQNGPLNVPEVIVSVQLAAAADLSALLVTGNGKVRSDADFVFFNQPTGPGVQLTPNPGGIASLKVSLAGVPADIEQVRAVITLDDTSSNFGRTAAPTARVSDTAGNVLYEYVIDGLSAESIVIALEVYRRQGAWKVRAVGQGYAGGFAALVTDHGVSVDDAPAPAQAAPAPAQAAPVQAAPPAYNPPPQQQPSYNAPSAPPAPPVYNQPPAAPAEVSLVKGRPVSLTKGQKVTLRKEGGVALTMIQMGLGWDPIKKSGMFGNRTANVD
ncbi:TerD family protein, partial [Rhodococcus sp. IEGM 1379]|uniref:TerD family protein n=1 Tax=Rhodococcus sp. IEGM 1379 TaxID=3047086 RepID=UPI0024B823BC